MRSAFSSHEEPPCLAHEEIADKPIKASSLNEIHPGITHDLSDLGPVSGFVAVRLTGFTLGLGIVWAALQPLAGISDQIAAVRTRQTVIVAAVVIPAVHLDKPLEDSQFPVDALLRHDDHHKQRSSAVKGWEPIEILESCSR